MPRRSSRCLGRTAVVAIALVLDRGPVAADSAGRAAPGRHDHGRAGAYDPARIEVRQNEILTVTFVARTARTA